MKAEKFNHPLLNMMNSPSSAADVWTRKQPETDTENKEPVDDVNLPPVHTYDELKKMRRNAYIKMAAIVGIIVTALAFGSVAWFTESREVEGSAVQMTSSDLPFEIATKGTKGIRYQSLLAGLDNSNKIGDTTASGGFTYYQTSGNTDKIMLRYDNGTSEIGPGGRGQLNLYLVPKDNINLKAKITLDVQSYALYDVYNLDDDGNKIQKKDENENLIYEEDGTTPVYQTTEKLLNVNDVTADMCTMTAEEINRIKQSAQYLKGHIMFFGGLSTDETKYYFTTPYTSWSFEFEQKNAVKGQTYQIPLYWMWSNTLGQIALKQSSTLRTGIPLVADLTNEQISDTQNYPKTDKAKVIQYLKDNKDIILKGWNSQETLAFTAEELVLNQTKSRSEIVNDMIENMHISDNFKRISNCYNSADLSIGTNIKYFTIEVIIENGE